MKKRWWIGLSLAIYAAVVGTLSVSHSIWLDEGQAWNIARDLPFFSMFTLSSYEGNGMLWHVMIYPLAHLGLPVISMQILNFVFSLATVYLIVKRAPFSVTVKLLIISGYFFVFEYAVLARNYQISVLILFVIAAIYQTRFARPWRYDILLVLLAFTNIHSAIIAATFICLFAYEAWRERSLVSRRSWFAVMSFIAYAGIAQIIMLVPVSNVAVQLQGFHLGLSISSIERALSAITNAFLPIPPTGPIFWNVSVFEFGGITGIVIASLIWLCSLVPFYGNKKALIVYVSASVLLLLFFFSKHSHYIRHDGFLFMLWLSVLWISRAHAKERGGWGTVVVLVFLSAQAVGGFTVLYYAYTEPVSNARTIADRLSEMPIDLPVIVYENVQAPAISAYQPSDREFYCLKTRERCSYIVWSTRAWSTIQSIGRDKNEFFDISKSISLFERSHGYKPYLILFNALYSAEMFGFASTSRLIAHADGPCITSNCSLYLYYVDPAHRQ